MEAAAAQAEQARTEQAPGACAQLIERIRREEFGVVTGEARPPAGGVRARQDARLARALGRLSADLYGPYHPYFAPLLCI